MFTDNDWKLFKSKIADWQEHYMERLCCEYTEILGSGGNASDRFWALEDRIKKDRKKSGVQCNVTRSEMTFIMQELIRDNVVTQDDLKDFSDEFRETMQMLTNGFDEN